MLYVDIIAYVAALRGGVRILGEPVELIYSGDRPIYASGGGGVIFKVLYRGELTALKCFTTLNPEMLAIYEDGLQNPTPGVEEFIPKYRYIPEAITVDTWVERLQLPVVLMEWVEGLSLDRRIGECCYMDGGRGLSELTDSFLMFAYGLLCSPTIHSDIKCENILIERGRFRLVDLDAVTSRDRNIWYSSPMISPSYNHPLLAPHSRLRDHYPVAIIVASLLALEHSPSLLGHFSHDDNLIFNPKDLIKGCDRCFDSLGGLFSSSHAMASLGGYITSASYPTEPLTGLLLDIMVQRGIMRYDMCDIDPRADGLYCVSGYRSAIGFATGDGQVAIEPQYLDAREFSEGRAAVMDGDGWHFIDRCGRRVSDRSFRAITSFREGVAAVAEDQLWGYIDLEGNYLCAPQFISARPMRGGVGEVVTAQGRMVVDRLGCVSLPSEPLKSEK